MVLLWRVFNIRNIGILDKLTKGFWTYEEKGILDSTHIRFFTLHEIEKMFDLSGFNIVEVRNNMSSTTPPLTKFDKPKNIHTEKVVLKNITKKEAIELFTIQFIVKATKKV